MWDATYINMHVIPMHQSSLNSATQSRFVKSQPRCTGDGKHRADALKRSWDSNHF